MLCTRQPLHKDRLQDLAATPILGGVPIFGKGGKVLSRPLRATAITTTAQGTVLQATFKGDDPSTALVPTYQFWPTPLARSACWELGAAVFIVGTANPDILCTALCREGWR